LGRKETREKKERAGEKKEEKRRKKKSLKIFEKKETRARDTIIAQLQV
jgi:hypothetical protein